MLVEALVLEGPRPRRGRNRHDLCAAASLPLVDALRLLGLRPALGARGNFFCGRSCWGLWYVSAVTARLVVALAGELGRGRVASEEEELLVLLVF